MKDAHDSGKQGYVAHSLNMSQARLGAAEGIPLIQQANLGAPALDVFTSF
jgi:hypothetical protein